jgi:hypothetical protein
MTFAGAWALRPEHRHCEQPSLRSFEATQPDPVPPSPSAFRSQLSACDSCTTEAEEHGGSNAASGPGVGKKLHRRGTQAQRILRPSPHSRDSRAKSFRYPAPDFVPAADFVPPPDFVPAPDFVIPSAARDLVRCGRDSSHVLGMAFAGAKNLPSPDPAAFLCALAPPRCPFHETVSPKAPNRRKYTTRPRDRLQSFRDIRPRTPKSPRRRLPAGSSERRTPARL